ncbi:uncharacterized protein M421DRAFT_311273 [Didymella exigua CBS 183.55]|uniref:Uncharacterized protein n=1 Tax=Didymella exigua CBS 183.55 TaxID=1150837 RepID=A0A6A5R919_9PLEO|nr:uncharacterized protein M421DRAFT_311273 [Didymella exigua CBS 183.55]KAF1923494.1 hypothetical protein M421DRAFT_311273 [Didymella exigua CBS 183.55]
MFEDIDITPTKTKKSKRTEPFRRVGSLHSALDSSGDEESSADEALAEAVEDLVTEAARWLRDEEDRERRRVEKVARRRRAATPLVVLSSSSATSTWSFIASNSSPLPVQSSLQTSTTASQTKRWKSIAQETATSTSASQTKRQKTVAQEETLRASSSDRATTPVSVGSETVRSKGKSNNGTGGATTLSKSTVAKKSSKRVCSIL